MATGRATAQPAPDAEPTALDPEAPSLTEPTPEPLPIVQALSRVMADVRAVGKDSQADAKIGGYKFRGVDAVVNAVGPALRRHGVIVMPEVLSVERVTTQSRQGASMLNVYVTTRFTFHGPAGDSLSTVVLGEAADAGDKATSKAQSVAFRVALLQALCLPTDDADPDAEGYERAGAESRPEPRQGRQQPRREQQGPPPEEGSQEPQEPPAHTRQFWEAYRALTEDQQTWVQENWGDLPQPNRCTVSQIAQALQVVGRVPPA